MTEIRNHPVVEVDSGDVKVQVSGRVARVTIDRPAKRNALTQEMYRRITDALLEADSDGEIGAVLLTGVDDVFTAGNDLSDFASGASLDQVVRFLGAISSVRVPLVAAVNGFAIGVGLTMLLHCDLVYVEPTAELSVPFVELGLVPEAASSLLLPRVIGSGERQSSFWPVGASPVQRRPSGDWPMPRPARYSLWVWRPQHGWRTNRLMPSGHRKRCSAPAIEPWTVGWPRR